MGDIYTSREMIEKLIGFNTTSSLSNLPLIEFVEEYLKSHGVESQRVYNEDKTKANLYATVGPKTEGGVVLSGHTDVVPVDGQPWETDPWSIVEKDGKLYGRGTCDMKSFSAIGLSLVPEMLKANLKKPIHFALSYDEEVGCVGAPAMISEMAELLPQSHAVIVGEPTDMKITNAHKGILGLRTHIRGHEVHSSQVERGVSAVMIGAKLVNFITEMMAANKAAADRSLEFDPPYSTLTVGVINGGTAGNIIARDCEFEWDIRTMPGDDPHQFVKRFRDYCKTLIPDMKKISDDCDIVTVIESEVPALCPEEDGAADALVRQLTGQNTTQVVPYAAEAGQFQEAGYSTIICGPGSIDQAHQPNEFIEISQVELCEKMLRRLIEVQA
ncbi:acetylornithine deacetylase [Curvivirga aplysinae]|uniref:acetylornithine deacetylase n=1 Tax=Curvivirga aplysinae TaxID=2529852 RepID=UPI0012BC39AA|nr:acetylornithine deacetylase [Curvivirga aplysinae]MTI11342.1 acetylornithine deacetylase [Curvivirga aplysinae]